MLGWLWNCILRPESPYYCNALTTVQYKYHRVQFMHLYCTVTAALTPHPTGPFFIWDQTSLLHYAIKKQPVMITKANVIENHYLHYSRI